jgi:hypothetical protein
MFRSRVNAGSSSFDRFASAKRRSFVRSSCNSGVKWQSRNPAPHSLWRMGNFRLGNFIAYVSAAGRVSRNSEWQRVRTMQDGSEYSSPSNRKPKWPTFAESQRGGDTDRGRSKCNRSVMETRIGGDSVNGASAERNGPLSKKSPCRWHRQIFFDFWHNTSHSSNLCQMTFTNQKSRLATFLANRFRAS